MAENPDEQLFEWEVANPLEVVQTKLEVVQKISGKKKLGKIERSGPDLSDKESILFYSNEKGIPNFRGYKALLDELQETKILGLTVFCNVPNSFEPDPWAPDPPPLVIVKDDSIILLDQFRRDEFDNPFSRLDFAKDKLSQIIHCPPDSFLKTLWLSHWYMEKSVGVNLEELSERAKRHNVQLLKPGGSNKDNLQFGTNCISLQEFLQSKRSERFEINRDEIFQKFQNFSHHSLTHVPLDVWRSSMDQRPGGINVTPLPVFPV